MKDKLNSIKRIRSEEVFTINKATRFGATPAHKNTFYNIQNPP